MRDQGLYKQVETSHSVSNSAPLISTWRGDGWLWVQWTLHDDDQPIWWSHLWFPNNTNKLRDMCVWWCDYPSNAWCVCEICFWFLPAYFGSNIRNHVKHHTLTTTLPCLKNRTASSTLHVYLTTKNRFKVDQDTHTHLSVCSRHYLDHLVHAQDIISVCNRPNVFLEIKMITTWQTVSSVCLKFCQLIAVMCVSVSVNWIITLFRHQNPK